MQAIVAVDNQWSIGINNQPLFRLREHRRNIWRLTENGTVIYGSKTFMGQLTHHPMTGRRNIILSRNYSLTVVDATVVHSIEELKSTVDLSDDSVYLIGGASLYEQLLPYCSHAIVTKVFATAPVATAKCPNLDFNPDWFSHDDPINHVDCGYLCRKIYYQHV